MASQQPVPQPKVNLPLVGSGGLPSLPWQQYLPKLDIVVRGLVALISGQFTSSVPLIAVAVPTNAHAAAAGVGLGQLYCDTADPCNVYIRTV